MKIEFRTRLEYGGILVALVALGGLANYFLEHVFRISCPIRTVTGLQCPGCGFSRCVQAISRGDLLEALRQNVLILGSSVLITGYLLLGLANPNAALLIRRFVQFHHRATTWLIFVSVGGFTLLRNIHGMPWA